VRERAEITVREARRLSLGFSIYKDHEDMKHTC